MYNVEDHRDSHDLLDPELYRKMPKETSENTYWIKKQRGLAF